MTGRMLKAFGSTPGDGVGQLCGPCSVSLDDDERIIVADMFNERLVLLDKQLMLQRVLVTWHRQSRNDAGVPYTLHYDSHSGRLLVGLHCGHVDIYQLRAWMCSDTHLCWYRHTYYWHTVNTSAVSIRVSETTLSPLTWWSLTVAATTPFSFVLTTSLTIS